jgi:hypothetical protein
MTTQHFIASVALGIATGVPLGMLGSIAGRRLGFWMGRGGLGSIKRLGVTFGAFAFALLATNTATKALSFDYSGCIVTAAGKIEAEDAYMLKYKIETNGWKVSTLQINSDGGSVYAAYQLGDMARRRGWRTYTDHCASSCVIIWASGIARSVKDGALIGVHEASDSLQFGPADSRIDMRVTAQIARRLRSLGAPHSVIAGLMMTKPSSMYWLSANELKEWR